MNTKEPFFGDDVTKKHRLPCTPAALKIPVSEEVQPTRFEMLPQMKAQRPARRPSMEPYFQLRPSNISSSLSSYAKLSDIFDYHYLPLNEFGSGLVDENAIQSDSDTEPEDVENISFTGTKFETVSERLRFRRFTAESLAQDADHDDSLHFRTFKHNSRSTGVPKKNESAIISDYFGELKTSEEFDALSVTKYLRIEPPQYKFHPVESLDTPSNLQLAEYLSKCSNPLTNKNCRELKLGLSAPTCSLARMRKTSDSFEGVQLEPFLCNSNDLEPYNFLV